MTDSLPVPIQNWLGCPQFNGYKGLWKCFQQRAKIKHKFCCPSFPRSVSRDFSDCKEPKEFQLQFSKITSYFLQAFLN